MKKEAFTLIELIFVIVIVGILATVALPKYQELTENSKISVLNSMVSTVRTIGASSALNYFDLNGNSVSDSQLNEFMTFEGSNVSYVYDNYGQFRLLNDDLSSSVLKVTLLSDLRQIRINVFCDNYNTSTLVTKCKDVFSDDYEEIISY